MSALRGTQIATQRNFCHQPISIFYFTITARARTNLKSSLRFGIGLKCGLSGALPKWEGEEEKLLVRPGNLLAPDDQTGVSSPD